MNPLEKVGLIALCYGVAMHTWHDVAAVAIATVLMFSGALLFLFGGHIAGLLQERWPDVPWL